MDNFILKLFLSKNKKYQILSSNIYNKLCKKDGKLRKDIDDEIEEAIKYCIDLTIYELDRLKKSKISIKDYKQYMNTLETAKNMIKPFSTKNIYLDNLPMHPSNIFYHIFALQSQFYNIEKKILKDEFSNMFSEVFGYSYTKIKMLQNTKKLFQLLDFIFRK